MLFRSDLVDGPGHISANKFQNFNGTLSIGGEFAPVASGNVFDGAMKSVPADYITVSESLLTGGNLLLAGSTVDLSQGTGLELAAGTAGGGDIVIFALGASIQPGNDGLPGGVPLGDISAPATGTVRFTEIGRASCRERV